MTSLPEIHPTDFEGQADRELLIHQLELAAEIQRREELRWMFEGRRGRRLLRRELSESGFNVNSDTVPTVVDRNHGTMCFNEGRRSRGLQLIWPLMRLLAARDISIESFCLLMTEEDDERG